MCLVRKDIVQIEQSLWAVTCASERHLDFEQRGKCLADFELLVAWEDAIEEAFEC